MSQASFPSRSRRRSTVLALLAAISVAAAAPAAAVVFDWDNFSGDSNFNNPNNWRPTASGPPPQAGDTALFDGQLENLGLGDNGVDVPDGTAINDMQVVNSSGFAATVVDLTIGDGTPASRFDLDAVPGPSLVVGNNTGDTATLNLLGGRLDTWDATIGGRAIVNVINEGTLWDSASILISGDTNVNAAGVGVGLRAQVATHGSLEVGSDTGSGRVVVESTGLGIAPSLWTVDGNVAIGPPNVFTFDFGSVTLRSGGHMNVGQDVDIHGGEVASTLSVQTGGELSVTGTVNLQENGVFELNDSASRVTTGDIDVDGGTLDWTGGTLHITDGLVRIDDSPAADLDVASLTIDAGMTLQVTDSSILSSSFRVGDSGTGLLTIQNGGVVESHNADIGLFGGSDGTATVTGSNSRWTVNEDLGVGVTGTGIGRLNIVGGEVSANSIWLGAFDAADGTVTVDGGQLTSTAVLAVGGRIADDGVSGATAAGSGQLNVENGGIVEVARTLVVFGGSRVQLTGGGSQLTADTIRLEPLGALLDSPGAVVRTNALLGFGDNAAFAGNLQIGHAGGTGSGNHAVNPGQTLSVDAFLTVGVDGPGTLTINDGTVNSTSAFIGGEPGADGSSVFLGGANGFWFANEIHIGGDGLAPQAAAVLTISGDGRAIVSDRIKAWGPGALILDSGVISTDFVEIEGELLGNGVILLNTGPTAVANRGLVAPGQSVGVITINGNASTADAYVQEPGGRLNIEIGGVSSGLYDRLDVVNGSAALDGFLDVILIDPSGGSNVFVPRAGDSFEFLSADNGTGGTRFDTQPGDLPALTGELFWEIVYGSDFVRLDVFSPYTADFDRDGDVDGDDLGQWEGDFGGPGSDADGDNDSDGADFVAWQRQYGRGVSPTSLDAVVPEPSSGLVLLAGLLLAAAVTAGRRRLSYAEGV